MIELSFTATEYNLFKKIIDAINFHSPADMPGKEKYSFFLIIDAGERELLHKIMNKTKVVIL